MMWIRKGFWKILRRGIFLLDAETAHKLSILFIRLGIRLGSRPLKLISASRGQDLPSVKKELEVSLFGMTFRSRVGLAAGFDKNAEIVLGLPALGFGFAEIGTVTPRPQAGNPLPRLFRDPSHSSLFNRMGFNGLGATIISERLKKSRENLPESFRVGVNLGKNKDTPNELAHKDYLQAALPFEGLADYLVVNVSSPNTPGLRSLQTVEALKPIIESLNDLISRWRVVPPLLLKLAPELSGSELKDLVGTLESFGVDGWVLTNTLAGTFQWKGRNLSGGWSGGLLKDLALQSLKEVRTVSQKPIISVGGISTPEEAKLRLMNGAHLIQIYSGWVYGGASLPSELALSLR